jgi:hypothetical protein
MRRSLVAILLDCFVLIQGTQICQMCCVRGVCSVTCNGPTRGPDWDQFGPLPLPQAPPEDRRPRPWDDPRWWAPRD